LCAKAATALARLSHRNSVRRPSVCLSYTRVDKKLYTGSRLAPNSMTLHDLERQNRSFMEFWRFRAVRHISRANFAEFTTDRPRQAAYEIFSIQRRFQRSRSRFPSTCA